VRISADSSYYTMVQAVVDSFNCPTGPTLTTVKVIPIYYYYIISGIKFCSFHPQLFKHKFVSVPFQWFHLCL